MLGFQEQFTYLRKLQTTEQLAQAYIFTGQAMIGKRTFAVEWAQQVAENDFLLIDATHSESGQAITVAEVRRIKNFLSLTPLTGRYKMVLIDEAERLTEEAQNALLKILEEPSTSAILVLITAYPGVLLSTVQSRCQAILFPSPARTLVKTVLVDFQLTPVQSEWLADFANGRIGLVKNILANSGVVAVKQAITSLADLLKADLATRFAFAQKMSEDEAKPVLQQYLLYWLLYVHTRIDEVRFQRIAKGLLRLYQTISQAQFNSRLALENFLINI